MDDLFSAMFGGMGGMGGGGGGFTFEFDMGGGNDFDDFMYSMEGDDTRSFKNVFQSRGAASRSRKNNGRTRKAGGQNIGDKMMGGMMEQME
jgi:hypothetical protein